MAKTIGINVDILITRKDKILLGLLNKKWCEGDKQFYGVPGRDINFGEKIGDAIKRNVKEELGCSITNYKIICVNANYAQGNHYIGIGVVAGIDGEPKLLMPEDWGKWEWFDKNNLPSNLHPATKNLIDCYLEDKVNTSE